MERCHHFARQIVNAHHFPDGIFHAKKLIANRAPNYANVSRAVHIILREESALLHVPALYVEVLGCDTAIRRVQGAFRSEEHTSELQSHLNLVCRLLLEKKKNTIQRSRQQLRAPLWARLASR